MKKRVLLLLLFAVQAQATKFLKVDFQPDSVAILTKFEIAFDVDRTYDNPFNPTEVSMDAVFTTPSGRNVKVPAFWFQEFRRTLAGNDEQLSAAAKAGWRVRFAADEIGTHSFYLMVLDENSANQSDVFQFTVTPSTNRGFIRVDAGNPRWLSFDDGSFYFPMGQNVAWAGSRGTFDYDEWMAGMQNAGENWMRVWLTHFSKGQSLEWNKNDYSGWYHGLGRYSQQGAWKLDHIVSAAEAGGIYIQLVTQHHGQFSQTVNSNWDDNPYNVNNGGFLNNGAEFFTNEQAKELYKRKMRYTVARWGYSTAILAWELWNEVQYTDNYSQNYPSVAAWHGEMAEYIHSIDPWRHPVTTSARDGDDQIWSLPQLDITQIHYYGPGVNEALRQRHQMMQQYGKPDIIGEFGDNTGTGGSDPYGTVIHQALWATAMIGGGAMPWWWDNYIHPNNLYYHWAAFSTFWQGEDLRTGEFGAAELTVAGGPQTTLGVRVAPGKGWEPSTQYEFWLQSDGSVPGIGDLSQYLHGSSKAEMGREAIFHAACAQDIVFALNVNSVSSWNPGKLQIFLDDQPTPLVNETPIPPKRYEVTVPAGNHRIRVFNAGVDWLTIEYFEFKGLAISAAAGYAFTNGQTAYAWIYDRDYFNGESPHESISGVELTFPSLGGKYLVEQWDTYTGAMVASDTVVGRMLLRFSPAPFSGDTALKLRWLDYADVADEATPINGFVLYPAFPNPFNNSTTLRIFAPRSEHGTITLLNLLGQELQTIFAGRLNAGLTQMNWSADGLSSGLYFVRAQSGGWRQMQKVVVVR